MVNTVALYLTCRAFVGSMIDAGWSPIVNVSSAASLGTPGPLNSAYATSKVARNYFTRQLAAEVSGTGVTANVIHPGEVKTEIWADIRDRALRLEKQGEGTLEWVRLVEETGGDPPGQGGGPRATAGGRRRSRYQWAVSLDRGQSPAAYAKLELAHRIPSVVPPLWPRTSFVHCQVVRPCYN